jgi:hypothetical protein
MARDDRLPIDKKVKNLTTYFEKTVQNFSLMILVAVLVFCCNTGYAGNIDPDNDGARYAYGENVGWVNFAPAQGPGVVVSNNGLTGYAWGENIGWINLSPTNGGVVNDSAGNLSSYAWCENIGWINFDGVKINTSTGAFSGHAWGENIGWINFAPDGVPIKTSWTPQPDTTPDPFTFTSQTGVALNTLVTSNTVTITGINMPAPISISVCASVLCEYSINGGAFTTSAGTVNSGDTVALRQTSSNSFSTTTTVTLSIGGVNGTFSVTTLAADTTPDPFTFTSLIGVALNTVVTSSVVTIAGINTITPISITGGEYSISSGNFTSVPGTVNNGDSITIRLTSSNNYFSTTSTTLTIGAVSGTFSVTTVTGNMDPNSDGSRYAYGENVGWINFKPMQGPGAVVSNTGLTGYAWGENIGWINLSPTNGGVLNDGVGNLSGYAWGENIGWINFNGVKINPSTGAFSGYAWGENIGWINFAPAGKGLKTSWSNPQTCTDKDNDGYAVEGGACGLIDCDDNDALIHPGANEVFNGIDDNCDGAIDEGFDSDNDGIADQIDASPNDYSNEFSDAATTSGIIINRGDQTLIITDEPDPAGVRIKATAAGGNSPSTVSVCGDAARLTLSAGDETVITCGSVEIEVINGTVEIVLYASDGTSTTTSLDAGNSLIFDPSTFTITVPETNSEVVVVVVQGEKISLSPGESISKICSYLGNDPKPSIPDVDVFKFSGIKGEIVIIRLEANPSGAGAGKRATLILTDKIKGTVLVKLDRSELPNEITAKLPKTGEYLVTVAQPLLVVKAKRYSGEYCLTLKASPGTYQILAPYLWVE